MRRVFQEQVLSPRILHFSTNELYWECQSYVGCECLGWEKRAESLQLETRKRKAHKQLISYKHTLQQRNGVEPAKERMKDFEAYRSLIEQYTRTHITMDLDRLPALSGISAGRQDAYLAGMWRGILEESLHWVTARDPEHCMAYRPEEYRAPSWSWAAVESPIGHIGEFSESYNHVIYDAGETVATVDSVACTPAGADARGRVVRGYLKIRGQTSRCVVTSIHVRDDQHIRDSFAAIKKGNLKAEVELDVPLCLARSSPAEVFRGQNLLLLRISKRVALVLQDVSDTPGAYTRVGIAHLEKNDAPQMFTDGAKESIFIL